MAWYHELLERATDKELSEAYADLAMAYAGQGDLVTKMYRAATMEQERRSR